MKSPRLLRGARALTLVGALVGIAGAHHIMGIPHYAYDESYPQAPVITYSVLAGPYTVKVTGYPGKPQPGQLAQVHAYVVRQDDPSAVYDGPVEARLECDEMFGPKVVWGPSVSRFEDNLHKLSPRFGGEGRYRIRLELNLEGQPYEIDFPLVVGDPGNPANVLLGLGAGLVVLVVVVRATRIKLERRLATVAGA